MKDSDIFSILIEKGCLKSLLKEFEIIEMIICSFITILEETNFLAIISQISYIKAIEIKIKLFSFAVNNLNSENLNLIKEDLKKFILVYLPK